MEPLEVVSCAELPLWLGFLVYLRLTRKDTNAQPNQERGTKQCVVRQIQCTVQHLTFVRAVISVQDWDGNSDTRAIRCADDPFPVSIPALMRELGNSPRGVSEGGAGSAGKEAEKASPGLERQRMPSATGRGPEIGRAHV